MKLLVVMLAAGLGCAQVPAPVQMLLGQWAVQGAGLGWVEFHMAREYSEVIGRAKPLGAGAKWQKMMAIYMDGPSVRADFFEAQGRTIHYQLDYSDATTLQFLSDPGGGGPVRTLTYEKVRSDRLSYRFEMDGKITDSGSLVAVAELLR